MNEEEGPISVLTLELIISIVAIIMTTFLTGGEFWSLAMLIVMLVSAVVLGLKAGKENVNKFSTFGVGFIIGLSGVISYIMFSQSWRAGMQIDIIFVLMNTFAIVIPGLISYLTKGIYEKYHKEEF